jgi:telomere length regulation protein
LIENKGVCQIVEELTFSNKQDDGILNPEKSTFISRVAQLLASIPDKATMGAASALTSSYPCCIYCISSSLN